MNSTEVDHDWYLRQQPGDFQSKKQDRLVDIELERIKSLGVVTVLNKSFGQDTSSSSSPTFSERSPSPGLTHSTLTNVEQATSCNNRISANSLRDTLVGKQSSPVLQKAAIYDEQNLLAAAQSHVARQKEWLSANGCMSDAKPYAGDLIQSSVNPVISMDDQAGNKMTDQCDALQARIKELEKLCAESVSQLEKFQKQALNYEQSQVTVEQAARDALTTTLEQKEMESVKVRQLSDVIFKQDRLVYELENHLEMLRLENERLKSTSLAQQLQTVRDELDSLRPELSKLLVDKHGCEQTINWLRDELEQSKETTRKTMDLSQDLQAQCVTQQTHIDSKLQLLTRLLQEKDQQIRRYRERTDRRVSAIPETSTLATPTLTVAYSHDMDGVDEDSGTLAATASRSTSFSSYSTPQPPVRDSCQSSSSTANLTTTTTSSASMSTIATTNSSSHFNTLPKRSYITKWATGPIPPAAPPPTDPLPALPSLKDDTPKIKKSAPVPSAKRNSILEFAKQLEERLSLSKDFNELCVWEPADFTLLPLTETPPPLPIEKSSPSKPKENSAFWKGVKKRFRV